MIKSRILRWADHAARMEVVSTVFKILTDTSVGKRPLGRHRRRWEDNNGHQRNGCQCEELGCFSSG